MKRAIGRLDRFLHVFHYNATRELAKTAPISPITTPAKAMRNPRRGYIFVAQPFLQLTDNLRHRVTKNDRPKSSYKHLDFGIEQALAFSSVLSEAPQDFQTAI